MLECIALLGGTFDPVHRGHTDSALALDGIFDFDEIRFLPCKQPVLKNKAHSTVHHRQAMLEIALAHHKKFRIDDREIQRAGPSYMIDSLISLHRENPLRSLCLVIGMDAFNDLPRWHRWEALFDYAHLIVINRPNVAFNAAPLLKQIIAARQAMSIESLKASASGKIYFQTLAETPISSTEIRHKLQHGESVEPMLNVQIRHYIRKHKLYQ